MLPGCARNTLETTHRGLTLAPKKLLQKRGDFKLVDPVQLARNLAKVFEHAAQIARAVAERPELAQKHPESQVAPIDQISKTPRPYATSPE